MAGGDRGPQHRTASVAMWLAAAEHGRTRPRTWNSARSWTARAPPEAGGKA